MALLSERDRAVLDFDALEFRHLAVRDCEIRRRFGWSRQVFAVKVAELHATPEGASYASTANRRRRRKGPSIRSEAGSWSGGRTVTG